MYIKQLSVFIENKEGRLSEVLSALKENNINIVSLSLADTSEYGLLRMIVSDPAAGKAALKERGFSAMITEVIAARLHHRVGKLQEVLDVICKAGINVEYMYALSTGTEDASIVIKPSNLEQAEKLLEDAKVDLYTVSDIEQMKG